MTPPEEQSGRNPGLNRFVPDEVKNPEPRFLADQGQPERPRFVLDPAEQDPPISSDSRATEARSTAQPPGVEQDAAPEEVSRKSSGPAVGDRDTTPDWRNLVSAKVNSYKSRRPRPHRYPSLQLQFEQAALSRESRGDPGTAASHYSIAGAAVPNLEARPSQFEAPPLTEATARVIEFPRSLGVPVLWDELAEPIIDRPRIVEAPEVVPPPPAMGGILIEPAEQPEPERRPGFDMPLASATLRCRFTAGLIDIAIVGLAIVAFGYVFLHVSDAQPTWKTFSGLTLALMAVLWPAYQFALVVFSGTTPGLRLCRLRIERFDGTPAPRKLRVWRVVMSLLSAISLAIGYLWCFLDEDQLSWHDRITSTHLANLSGSGQNSRQAKS